VCVLGLTAAVKLSKKSVSPTSDILTFSIFSGLFTFSLFWVLAFNLQGAF
jgi:hypothetical protein